MIKAIGWVFCIVGMLAVIGTAGADCDGKCMENALSLTQIALYTMFGMCATAIGALMIAKG